MRPRIRNGRSNDVFPQGLDHCFRHAGYMQLLIYSLDIGLHRLETDVTGICDHFIAEPVDKTTQDLLFAFAEIVGLLQLSRREMIPEETKYLAGDDRRHRGPALAKLPDKGKERPGQVVLKDIARGAGADRREHAAVVVEYGFHQYPHRRILA